MPTLDFRYVSLVQALEDDLLLAEPLFFPDISTLGDDQAALVSTVGSHVQTALEALPAKEIHRHRAAGALRTAQIEVEVSPLRATIGWREPVTLTFHYVQWEHGEEAHIAYVPALGIETVAATARGLEKTLPQDIRAALFRRGVAKSLRGVVELQRIRDIEAVESQVAVRVRSPLEEREQAEPRKPSKSALEEAATELTPSLVGRAFEVSAPVARLAETLAGDHRPGVLLVGPSGVGKTAVVHELVARRREFRLGKTPFWSTSGARLVAGMSGYGMWQERCQKIVKEASATRAVLHVESLVELLGVGKGSLNEQGIAAFFRPYIERGDLQVIAECVPEQIPVIEREEPQLLAVLQRIDVAQPTGDQSGAILRRAAGGQADSITDEAIETIDRLHRRFATCSALPGRPLRFLKNLLPPSDEEVEMVTERDVVAAFAEETGLPRFLLDGDQPLRLDETRGFLSRRVMGQPRAVDLVVDVLATVKAGLTPAGRPISSLLFIGPTGVGKTEMAKALAEFMYQSPARMIRVDMSEYADRHSVDRLIGGSLTAEGLLTAKIREQPFSVVLLDEFEKAHAAFLDLLLQVLGEGRLTDGAGRVASFGNAIILMTSNLGVDSFGRAGAGFGAADDRLAQSERHFVDRVQEFVRPEFFNRIDRIVPFAPLDRTTIRAIARRELDKMRARDGIRHRRLDLDVDPAVVDFLADRGYEPQYGARPLQRAIDRRLVTRLAECANRYAADLAIEVRAEMVDGAVSTSARARPTGERASASAGTSDQGRLDLASKATLLRRRVQILDVSSFMQDVRNELQRLEHQQRRLKKVGRRGRIAGRNATLAAAADASVRRLRERVRDMVALMGRVSRLEDEVLSAFYADGALDDGRLETSMQEVTDEFERLAMAGLVETEDPPERITLVISGRDGRQIADLAAAYLAVVAGRGGKPALSELHRHPPLRTSLPLRHVSAVPPELTIYARPIRDAAPYLKSPPESLVGAAVSVAGRTFSLLLSSEHGNHVFRERGASDRCCRVDVVAGRVVDCRLPPRFGRRDTTRNLETRRVYDFSQECVFDSGQSFRFGAKGSIDDALSGAVGRRVADMIEAGLGEW